MFLSGSCGTIFQHACLQAFGGLWFPSSSQNEYSKNLPILSVPQCPALGCAYVKWAKDNWGLGMPRLSQQQQAGKFLQAESRAQSHGWEVGRQKEEAYSQGTSESVATVSVWVDTSMRFIPWEIFTLIARLDMWTPHQWPEDGAWIPRIEASLYPKALAYDHEQEWQQQNTTQNKQTSKQKQMVQAGILLSLIYHPVPSASLPDAFQQLGNPGSTGSGSQELCSQGRGSDLRSWSRSTEPQRPSA